MMVHISKGKGRNRGFFGFFVHIGLNGVFECVSVFDSCVKNCQYFRTDNISLETSVHWLSGDVVSFEIEVGVHEKFAKM